MHDMSDFLSHTYKSLFDQERKQLDAKKKKVPLAFSKPTALFVEDDVFLEWYRSQWQVSMDS